MPAFAASLLLAGSAVMLAMAEPSHHHGDRADHTQAYAGQQYRAIASFSSKEIEGYRQGRGMGLARPAELNGYPGPMHVLELAHELGLTAEQRKAVEAIFARMKDAAQAAGARYLEAEGKVDAVFRSGDAKPDQVSALVRQADSARADVRLAHLTAHIETAPLLSSEQRSRYAALRGVSSRETNQDHHSNSHRERVR